MQTHLTLWQTIRCLLNHRQLADRRAIDYETNRFAKVMVGIAFLVTTGYLMMLAVLFALIANDTRSMTALSMNRPNMPMQKFAINYSEINNVTETGKTICIYTAYATYEVLALHNRSEAVNEIRKRISKNAEK